jgi:hypothetical protein
VREPIGAPYSRIQPLGATICVSPAPTRIVVSQSESLHILGAYPLTLIDVVPLLIYNPETSEMGQVC